MLANKSFRSSFAVPRRSVVLSVAGVISVPRPSSVMAQAAPSYEVVVKGNPDTNTLGDCPFCHRVLLTLANKHVPYSLTYVDFARKPEWLIAASGGKVPVLRKTGTDFVMPDSDVITEYLEKEVPEPSMKSDVDPVVGSKLFPAFRQFLFSEAGSADEKEKRAALEAELKALNDYLSQPGKGPLFGGDKLNATDAAVAPKLYHCQVALAHYKEYQIPESFTALQTYFDAIKVLPAWQQTDYGAMSIIDGWSKHH